MSIDDKLTFSEAAKEYNIKDTSTLRKAVAYGRFRKDEIELRGKTYFVKKSAMDRLYGHRKKGIADRVKEAQARSELTRFSYASKKNPDIER